VVQQYLLQRGVKMEVKRSFPHGCTPWTRESQLLSSLGKAYWVCIGIVFLAIVGTALLKCVGAPAVVRLIMLVIGYISLGIALYANHRQGVLFDQHFKKLDQQLKEMLKGMND